MKGHRTLVAAAAANGVALAATSAVLVMQPAWGWAQTPAEPNKYEWGPHNMMMWDGSWYMIFGPVFMILTLAAVIAVVVLLVRWLGGPWYGAQPPYHAPPGRTPLDILRERFARGEIDKDEFEERRRVLDQ